MAEAELQDAAPWYDERSPGPGLRFVLTVRAKTDEIAEAPPRWPLAAGTRRECPTALPERFQPARSRIGGS